MNVKNFAFSILLISVIIVGCNSLETEQDAPSQPAVTVINTSQPSIGVYLATSTLVPSATMAVSTPETSDLKISPTVTATPNYHTIVAGDTLFDIALSRNITVDDIILLNPEINPELLPVGGVLILPPIDLPVKSQPSSEVIAESAQIVGIHLHDSTSGGLFLLGEVENRGQQALENIQVETVLQDTETGAQEAVRFWVEPGIVPWGAKAPFGNHLVRNFSSTRILEAKIVSANEVVDLGNRYLDLTVDEAMLQEDNGGGKLSGTVLNSGGQVSNNIRLVASFYDEDKSLSSYYLLQFDETIRPGEQRPFEILILTPGNPVVSFEIIVQGFVVPSD